jgi:hypothetical protein
MYELPRPETSYVPETPLFNVDAMSDEQIIVLYRGLISIYESEEVMVEHSEHEGVADGILTRLEADLSDLTSRDPERVKNLVANCVESVNESDHELALNVVTSLVDYDYSFTRDALLSLSMGSGHVSEGADMRVIPRLMRDRLTEDQIADFNARLRAAGNEPIDPAQPED